MSFPRFKDFGKQANSMFFLVDGISHVVLGSDSWSLCLWLALLVKEGFDVKYNAKIEAKADAAVRTCLVETV
jgi:hypothetical protein